MLDYVSGRAIRLECAIERMIVNKQFMNTVMSYLPSNGAIETTSSTRFVSDLEEEGYNAEHLFKWVRMMERQYE